MVSARAFRAAVLSVLLATASASAGATSVDEAEVVPHLAVYEVTLLRAEASAGIEGFEGRLAFEARGSSCAGYETTTRFVGRIEGRQGDVVTDTRSTTEEDGDGERFAFTTERFMGDELVEHAEGVATHRGDAARLELEEPEKETLDLPPDVMFPTQHMLRLLQAMREEERIVTAPVFDGSETGRIVYETTAVIGERRPPMGEDEAGRLEGATPDSLAEWSSWPVTIAYFDPDGETPDVPSYQFTYDLFGNGISRSLRLDYGEFVLEGRLRRLELGDPPPCSL